MLKARVKFDRSKFRRVRDSLEVKTLKRVVREQSKVIAKRVKALAPKESGALRFSIGVKVLTRRGSATAIIGARASYEATKKGKLKKPFKYAPIVQKHKDYLIAAMGKADIEALRNMVRDEIRKALR